MVKALIFLILHASSDLCIGSRLMKVLNIIFSHSPIKFSQPADVTTYTLFSLHVEPTPHPLLPLLDHLYLPCYKSPTTLLDTTCEISLLCSSTSSCSLHSPPGSPYLAHITLSQTPSSLPQSITPSAFYLRQNSRLLISLATPKSKCKSTILKSKSNLK